MVSVKSMAEVPLPLERYANTTESPPALNTIEAQGKRNKSAYLKAPEVWVHKYADFSSKYGLGYILVNNCIGVLFNDNSLMSQGKTDDQIYYIKNVGANQDGLL